MKPVLTIIVPVYNIEPYLPRCLDAIRDQSFMDWECLCVDDGSTDGSGRILDDYARSDDRFRIFHQKNGGVSSARNLALSRAKGRWIWFVDGDDEVAPESFAHLMTMTDGLGPKDLLVFSFRQGSEGWGKESPSVPAGTEELSMEGGGLPDSAFARMGLSTIWHMLWGAETVGDIMFEPFALTEDTLFAYTAALRAKTVRVTEYPGYYYYLRAGSAVSASSSSKVVDRVHALDHLLKLLVEEGREAHARSLLDREWIIQGVIWIFRIPKWRNRRLAAREWYRTWLAMDGRLHTPRSRFVMGIYRWTGCAGLYLLVYLPFVTYLASRRSAR